MPKPYLSSIGKQFHYSDVEQWYHSLSDPGDWWEKGNNK